MMLQLLPNITISLVDNFFKAGASLNTCVATKHDDDDDDDDEGFMRVRG
jgi:hypothetical protein